MLELVRLAQATIVAALRSRRRLVAENLLLRQQLQVAVRSQRRPRLRARDKILWLLVRRLHRDWRRYLLLVRPETVQAWHRRGWRLFCIGKSALLQRVRRRAAARGARVLATVGVESEAEFAFAGLHQLLRPVSGVSARLPDSQRGALDAALGRGGDIKPDPFSVAFAAFQLVCEAADSVPAGGQAMWSGNSAPYQPAQPSDFKSLD